MILNKRVSETNSSPCDIKQAHVKFFKLTHAAKASDSCHPSYKPKFKEPRPNPTRHSNYSGGTAAISGGRQTNQMPIATNRKKYTHAKFVTDYITRVYKTDHQVMPCPDVTRGTLHITTTPETPNDFIYEDTVIVPLGN